MLHSNAGGAAEVDDSKFERLLRATEPHGSTFVTGTVRIVSGAQVHGPDFERAGSATLASPGDADHKLPPLSALRQNALRSSQGSSDRSFAVYPFAVVNAANSGGDMFKKAVSLCQAHKVSGADRKKLKRYIFSALLAGQSAHGLLHARMAGCCATCCNAAPLQTQTAPSLLALHPLMHNPYPCAPRPP